MKTRCGQQARDSPSHLKEQGTNSSLKLYLEGKETRVLSPVYGHLHNRLDFVGKGHMEETECILTPPFQLGFLEHLESVIVDD